MAKLTVTLGYSRSKGEYHVDEIRGHFPYVPHRGEPSPIRVGIWLTEVQACDLGTTVTLVVRPYRAEA